MITVSARTVALDADEARAVVRRELVSALDRMVLFAQRVAKMEAPANTGQLRNSILTFREDRGPAGVAAGIATGLPYALAMEDGRRPGKGLPPAETKPGGALYRWVWLKRREFTTRIYPRKGVVASAVRRAGGRIAARRPSQERQVRTIAFLISRRIKERGIKGRKFFAAAQVALQERLGQFVAGIGVNIQKEWDKGR